jgi:type IV fimbrial biogenesis protein FimT
MLQAMTSGLPGKPLARRQPGVTALELAVGMAIVAIVVAAGVPGLRAYVLEQRMKASVTALHAGLALARNEAVSRQARTVVCPLGRNGGCADHARWHEGWLVFEDLNADREWQADDPALRRAPKAESLSVTGSESRNRLRFFPAGSAPGSNATITFCDARGAGRARQLVISASGRIRQLQAGEVSGVDCAR